MIKMHDDEVDTRIEIVRRLLAAQFPSWKNLPLEMIQPAGTDNAIYRLGDDKMVRLPRKQSAEPSLEKEITYLPFLQSKLPIAIPRILAQGVADHLYPFPWLVMDVKNENSE